MNLWGRSGTFARRANTLWVLDDRLAVARNLADAGTWTYSEPLDRSAILTLGVVDDSGVVGGRWATIGILSPRDAAMEWIEIPALDEGDPATTNHVLTLLESSAGFVAMERSGRIAFLRLCAGARRG